MGLSIVDMLAGAHLAQGLLACLYRKAMKGEGGLVQVSMLESAYDFQFETITTFFNDGGVSPERSQKSNANAYLGAPYGIYKTANGHLALAMGSIPFLKEAPEILVFPCKSENLTRCLGAQAWDTFRRVFKVVRCRI